MPSASRLDNETTTTTPRSESTAKRVSLVQLGSSSARRFSRGARLSLSDPSTPPVVTTEHNAHNHPRPAPPDIYPWREGEVLAPYMSCFTLHNQRE
jgi:hypothetical protein